MKQTLKISLIIGIVLPITLNLIFTAISFENFGGFHNNFVENIANLIFYANWPSLLLGVYPYVLSTDNEIVFEMFGWINPIVLIINAVGWIVLAFIVTFLFKLIVKNRKI